MKTIKPENTFLKKVLGNQNYSEEDSFHFSKFCMIKEVGKKFYLYSNLTKAIILLDRDEYDFIESKPSAYDSAYDWFYKNWIMISDGLDENELCDSLYRVYSSLTKKSGITFYTILTTTDCNARCFYCYEHGVTKRVMSENTAVDVANYIINKSKGEKVFLKWFGGEPLYNETAIDIITQKLQDNGIEFNSRMISNGYLFDKENVKKARNKWHLHKVQITLDGTEGEYNRIKAFIYDDVSPFRRVINNIEALLNNDIRVTVRINVSDENIDNVYELIDYVERRFEKYDDMLSIYASNLFDLDHTNSEERNMFLLERFKNITDSIYQSKFKGREPAFWYSYERGCMSQNDRSVVISPDGLLGRCEHFSEGSKMYGSIYSEKKDMNSYNYWKEFKRVDLCKNCIMYPNCHGVTHCPNFNDDCTISQKGTKIFNLERAITRYIADRELDD